MSINTYQSRVAQLAKQKASLEQDKSREMQKIAKLTADIGALQRSIIRSTTASTNSSKLRQIESKHKDLVTAQKKFADIEGKISKIVGDLNTNLQSLERARTTDSRKQEVSEKKRRGQEIQHTKEVTRQLEQQARLRRDMQDSHFVIDLAQLPTEITVLFLAANPRDRPHLALDEEIRLINQQIRASKYRDAVNLVSHWAVRPGDLLQVLNETKPHIIHFSGHGTNGRLIFVDDRGEAAPVKQEAIVSLMSVSNKNLQVVIFNACLTSDQARAVTEYVPIAIGMSEEISEEAAQHFAGQFYSAIGFGLSVQAAFDQGRVALMLQNIREEDTPQLFTQDNVDANKLILVRPADEDFDLLVSKDDI